MCLVEAHSGLECRCPRHEVVDADDLLLVARADGGAAGVAVHAVPCRALAWVGVALQLRGQNERVFSVFFESGDCCTCACTCKHVTDVSTPHTSNLDSVNSISEARRKTTTPTSQGSRLDPNGRHDARRQDPQAITNATNRGLERLFSVARVHD